MEQTSLFEEPKNKHHQYWPRSAYKTPTEKAFRTLACNIVVLPIDTHRLIHVYNFDGPPKPEREFMLQAIQSHKLGECACKEA